VILHLLIQKSGSASTISFHAISQSIFQRVAFSHLNQKTTPPNHMHTRNTNSIRLDLTQPFNPESLVSAC
jgi:hypothetical protein